MLLLFCVGIFGFAPSRSVNRLILDGVLRFAPCPFSIEPCLRRIYFCRFCLWVVYGFGLCSTVRVRARGRFHGLLILFRLPFLLCSLVSLQLSSLFASLVALPFAMFVNPGSGFSVLTLHSPSLSLFLLFSSFPWYRRVSFCFAVTLAFWRLFFLWYAFLVLCAEENDGEPVDDLALMRRAYTNKKTGQIDDGLVRDVVDLVQTQVVDEVSQLQTEDDASTASTNLSRFRINEIVESSVPKKKGCLVGSGRRTRSIPPSYAPQPFVDPEVLTAQLKDKEDRISLLETQMAAQQAGYEAQRRLNQQMMEMMQRMYPNEGTVPRYIPRDMFLGIFRGTEGHVPRNIPRDMFLGIFRSIDVYMSKNASIDEFRGNIPTKFSLGIFRGDFRQTSDPRNFLGNLVPRNSVGNFRGISEERRNFEDLFRRYVVGITIFRRNSDDFFPQNPCCFLVVLVALI
ncbi:hypothetical protein F2Q69_00037127 [Brassica cretica]|uniref:Uncharacterized protein n=1 Tax=Brassica cretica TaxID=69181 RepID=A0A8S9SIC8_BRACR|nr:hypothetical protein F2Q69_00037127 [Brassica cretica]